MMLLIRASVRMSSVAGKFCNPGPDNYLDKGGRSDLQSSIGKTKAVMLSALDHSAQYR